VPAKDRRNAWTLGGIAIDQVSKYKYPGVVYQEDGSWHTRKGACKDASSLWVLEATAACSSLPTKVRLLMVQTFIYSAVMYGGSVGHDEGGQRQDVSGRKESSPQHSSPASRDCSSDVLYGDTGLLPPGVLIDAAKLCWQHRCQNMEAGRWPKEALRFSFEGSRVSAGLWHGLVQCQIHY
jgi:hypothetical protein